jgi:pSer/pThr/pTyr-binding forkhead associated (FHA) protein
VAVKLIVVEGPHQGRTFTFHEHDNFIVGRSSRTHFQLPELDRSLGRFHFMIEVNPPACRILDLDSRNGTYVNKTRVTTADLKDGDVIRAGRNVFRLDVEMVPNPEPALEETVSPHPGPPSPAGAAPVEPAGLCPICSAPIEGEGGLLCAGCEDLSRQQTEDPRIRGYRVIRELASGGMGKVYLAVCEGDATPVALKVIRCSTEITPEQLARFVREASVLKELRHPSIVAYRDMGGAHGVPYLVMEYAPGKDASVWLQEFRDAGGLPPVAVVARLICQLLEALAHAHANRFVHRDVKPANLLLVGGDEEKQVKLADFGLARVYQASRLSGLTLTDTVGGSGEFMSPEHITGFREASPAADQYSAGVTLYRLLTAESLFEPRPSTRAQLYNCILTRAPVPLDSRRPDLPDGLGAVVHRAISKEPEDRFPDVEAFRKALKPYA